MVSLACGLSTSWRRLALFPARTELLASRLAIKLNLPSLPSAVAAGLGRGCMRRLVICSLLALCVAPAALPRREINPDLPLFSGRFVDDGATLPDEQTLRSQAQADPIAFLESCLRRYLRDVKGYTCLLAKRECIAGHLMEPELVEVAFREQPHSVLMHWVKGARRVETVLYVEGENQGQALIQLKWPLSLVGLVQRDPEGQDARDNGRYPLSYFGLRYGTERVLGTWYRARRRGSLHVTYLGTQAVPQLGGRACHVLHRSGYDWPEDDGITDLVMYIDCETWLQVGTVLHGASGELIAEYFLRDVKLNPRFPAGTFTRQSLH
jgi:hypothetical protein